MSISGISGSSSLSYLQMSSSSSSSEDTQKSNFDDLLEALESGDLDAAKAAYEKLTSSSSDSSSSSSSDSSEDPFQEMLDEVGAALESGDITAAQDAVESNRPAGPPPPPPPSDSTSDTSSEETDAFSSLVAAIQSGDTDAATEAYDTLTSLLGENTDENNPLAQSLDQIGEALSSGDMTSAQQILSQMAQAMRPGSMVDTSA